MQAWVTDMDLVSHTRLVRGADRPLGTKISSMTLMDAKRTGNNECDWNQTTRPRYGPSTSWRPQYTDVALVRVLMWHGLPTWIRRVACGWSAVWTVLSAARCRPPNQGQDTHAGMG